MVDRREFLRKATVGTGAFAVPMILTVDPADAQAIASPPPESTAQTPPATGVTGSIAPGPAATSRPASGRSELPRTGADIDRLVAAGLAVTATGAALLLWSADAGSHAATSAATPDPPAEPSRADPES
jgi:hypothetical protein